MLFVLCNLYDEFGLVVKSRLQKPGVNTGNVTTQSSISNVYAWGSRFALFYYDVTIKKNPPPVMFPVLFSVF